MINSVCGIRSTGRICTDLAADFEREGHTVKIAYGRETVPEKYQKYATKIGTSCDVYAHALISRLLDNTGSGSRSATLRLISYIEDYDPEVIHLHNLHGYYVNLKVLFDYLKVSGKPVIWTLHDCWAFTGHCAHYDYIGCNKWQLGGCHHCPQKKSYPTSVFLDCSRRNFKGKQKLFCGIPNLHIVTPSNWLAEQVKLSFLKEYPIHVIHNGIDTSVFKPTHGDFRAHYHLENQKIVLGVASAWEKMKGLSDFIELSKLLTEDYRIVLVGLTEKQKESLPSKIIGITRTNSICELAEIYTAADVFVNLTKQEVLGLVNLEAQACGTPALTYATGGSIETVPQSHVVPKNDVKGMFSQIQKILTTGQCELINVQESFGLRDQYKSYCMLYKNCIK